MGTDTETATVVSAVKLDSEQQLSIAKQLQRLTGRKNIKLKPQVDENLLGGFVLKFGKDASMQIDISIKGQLEKIEEVRRDGGVVRLAADGLQQVLLLRPGLPLQ